MDHLRFKSNHTAAAYVANGLDLATQEAFELHLLSCAECVNDVEIWRTIKNKMPRDLAQPMEHATPARHPAARWRMAASLVATGLLGAVGGWYLHSAQAPWADPDSIVFQSLPPLTRGLEDCSPIRVGSQTRLIALRIPGAVAGQHVAAIGDDGHDLDASAYSVVMQSDGSWLVRMPAELLEKQSIRFESRGTEGPAEPLGCVSAVQIK